MSEPKPISIFHPSSGNHHERRVSSVSALSAEDGTYRHIFQAYREQAPLQQAVPTPAKQPKSFATPTTAYAAIPSDIHVDSYGSGKSAGVRRAGAWTRGWDRVASWWVWELLCMFISIACFGGIVAIGMYLHGLTTDDWHSSISPNAMLSTLTTVSKATALFAIASCISQLKWLHFERRPHRLQDMDVFNDASTSPVGAVQFLCKMKASAMLASFASLLVILALLFEPMAQQVLAYESIQSVDPSVSASVPTAQIYDMGGDFAPFEYASFPTAGPQDWAIDDRLQIALFDGFFGSASGSKPASMQLPVDCQSGNCTFAPFTTLGVCGSCEDPKPDVQCSVDTENRTQTCIYTTDQGNEATTILKYIPATNANILVLNSSARAPPPPPPNANPLALNTSNWGAPSDFLASFLVMRMQPPGPFNRSDLPPDWPLTVPPLQPKDAWECSLRWCAQTFEHLETNSSKSVSVEPSKTWPLKVAPGPPPPPYDPNALQDTALPEGLWAYNTIPNSHTVLRGTTYMQLSIDGDTSQLSPDKDMSDSWNNVTFTINAADNEGIRRYLQTFLNATRGIPKQGFTTQADGNQYGKFDLSGPLWNSDNISDIVHNAAVSFSNAIRQTSNASLLSNPSAAPTKLPGVVWVNVTQVDVYWAWLTLPALVVGLGLLILIASIVAAGQSHSPTGGRSVPLWKASNVGIFSVSGDWQGPSGPLGGANAAATKQQAKDWARNTQMQLMRDDEGRLRFRSVGT